MIGLRFGNGHYNVWFLWWIGPLALHVSIMKGAYGSSAAWCLGSGLEIGARW